MRSAIVTSCLILTAACAGPSDPAAQEDEAVPAALVANFPQVFALGMAEGIAAEPVVTFDHTCQGIRYVHAVRDSIVLNPDFTAVRTIRLDRFANHSPLDSSIMVSRGSWRPMPTNRRVYYFGDGPSIELTLTLESSRAHTYTMPLRLDGADALTNMSPMGGSCPGSPNDARNAQFKYTRR